MIYKKDANFPYPVLTNGSTSYENSEFLLEVTLQEDVDKYRFSFTYEISSLFIKQLISNGEAVLILIIQSKDSKFFKLEPNQASVDVPKERISINNRTSIQMHIQSKQEIYFSNNDDLSSFYEELKDQLIIPKNLLLGFSNIVTLEGRMHKPLDLFEKKLDENLQSEIKIELGAETIIIHYKKPEFLFGDIRNKALNNPYIYTGLRTALLRFVNEYSEVGDDYVDLSKIMQPEDLLDYKLFNLMQSKMVNEISVDSIDEVIAQISDRIIEKYASAVKELARSED